MDRAMDRAMDKAMDELDTALNELGMLSSTINMTDYLKVSSMIGEK